MNRRRERMVAGTRPVRTDTFTQNRGYRGSALHQYFCWGLGGALLLSGCGTAHYRGSADKEVYGVIHQVESQALGVSNAFTIETEYSSRKPEDINPGELIEDRLQTNRRVLTIDAALDLAVERSRRYQTAKEALYLSGLGLTGQRYAFSPHFFASSAGSFVRTSEGERLVQVQNRIGVDQLLKTGGRLSVSLANDLLRYYTGEPRRSVLSLISVDLVQPLLRGFGRNSPAVESLTQSERNLVYSVRTFNLFQQQFALDIVNDYFDLLAEKQVIRNRYTNYLGRVQATERLAARAQDRERLSDVDQARQAELTAKNNYVNAVAGHRNSLDAFKIRLGLALGEKVLLDDQALFQLEETGLVPLHLDEEETYRFAVHHHLEILNAIDQFEDLKRKVRVAADQLKAELNLFGSADLGSEPPTDYARFDPDKVSASVGLELNLPLDRLRERNNYRATLILFEAGIRNLTLTLDSLKESIQGGLRTLEQRRQNFEIQKNALELANRRVASATMLLEAGRAEVRDLIEAQDAQVSAENAVTVALVSYQQSRLQLLFDTGALDTDLPEFWLKEHVQKLQPAPRPTAEDAELHQREVLPPDHYFED